MTSPLRHKSKGRSILRGNLILLITTILLFNDTSRITASAEVCPKYVFTEVFDGNYYKDYLWQNQSGARKITWSLQNSTIELKDIKSSKSRLVSRRFSEVERTIIRLAFKNWDDASEKINFEEVMESASPDIKIGFVTRNAADEFTTYFWNFGYTNTGSTNSPYNMIAATIILADDNNLLASEAFLLNLVQNALGRVLGLGNVLNSFPGDSVLKWPVSTSTRNSPLSDLDIGLLRQRYGESTCPSSFSWAIKEQRAKTSTEAMISEAERKSAEIISIANGEAARIYSESRILASRIEKEARLQFEKILAEANQARDAAISESNRILEEAKAKITKLLCIQGKIKFTITAIKPKCPKGFIGKP